MNKRIANIIFLLIAVLIIIILIIPKKENKRLVVVTNFEIMEKGPYEINQEVRLVISLDNTQKQTIDNLIINSRQIDSSSFDLNSSLNRIYINYILSENDFNNNNLYLLLEAIMYLDHKVTSNKIIYKRG